jgi:taurine dioxygenase
MVNSSLAYLTQSSDILVPPELPSLVIQPAAMKTKPSLGPQLPSIRPLPGPLGTEINDVDASLPLTPYIVTALLEALYDRGAIVLPGQSLTPAELDRFARCFGRPQPHILSHLRLAENPNILRLSNVVENGEPIGVYEGAAYWHTDMSFEADPAMATIVYSIEAPESGGETLIANMFLAYESLPRKTRQSIDALTVLHHYGNRDDLDESSAASASPLSDEQKQQVQNVFHPLVRRHPATGRKALYAVTGSSFGIVGMPDDEAMGLLDELGEHATQPEFTYRHRYGIGDIVVWDNNSTLHAATPIAVATGPHDTRLLHRVSVKADPSIDAFRA